MSNVLNELRGQKQEASRLANKLLADKGSQQWSTEDQKAYDGYMNNIELLNGQIKAHEDAASEAADKSFGDIDQFRNKGGKPKQMSAEEKGFDVFLRVGRSDWTNEHREAIKNTMSTTTGAEGGYTVMPLIASQLIEAQKAYSFMRQEATILLTGNGADLSYPTTDGTAEVGEWVTQNSQGNGADIVFGTRPLNVFKAGSKIVTVPIELLQDSQIDVSSLVMNRLGQRIGRIGNQGYSVGSGSGQPNGLFTAATVGKAGSTGQTVTVTYDDLVDLRDSLDVSYLLGGGEVCWMFNQTTRRVVSKLKDTAGRPIWVPSYDGGITGNVPDTLLGYKVCLNNDAPSPAANAKSIAFGQLSAYVIRDAMEVTMFKFDDSVFISKGCYGFLAWARTGGNLMDTGAVKLYQHSAT